ncbi:MAG: hypothetical protein HGB12_03305 [Bacteroidetes bacterium]|nr:hypothetical protein [Bacteroidota bacterium]
MLAKLVNIFLPFIFVILVCSCSQQRQLAKEFLNKKDSLSILILRTDTVFKKNLKKNNDSISDTTNSLFLGKTKNITLINLIYTGLIDELKKRKLKVYTDENMNSFMSLPSESYIFNMSQIEMDEYVIPYSFSQDYDEDEYYQDFNLNAVSLNTWFEVSELNGEQEKSKVLYSSKSINDNVYGYFRRNYLYDEIYFNYRRTDITLDDIYKSALNFGYTNADYIFDYFLNQYVYENYKGKMKKNYLHYDIKKNRFIKAEKNRFIFM